MHYVNGIASEGQWFLAQGTAVMIRARQDLLTVGPESGLSERVVVTWQCRAPIEIGLPSESDYKEIAEFEEILVAFVEEGAILAFVVTQDGCVNLHFYTANSEWFLERLNEALADKP